MSSEILRGLRDHLFRLLGVYPHLSSEAYIELARAKGAEIGSGTEFIGEKKLDLDHAAMITIGDDCMITDHVRLLAHTYDTPHLRNHFEDEPVPDHFAAAPIEIGDNVFVGEDTMVLPGVTVGSNVILGARAVVTDDIPDDCVAVGNPCEPVMSLDEYRANRLEDERSMVETYVRQCEERSVDPLPGMRAFLDDRE